MPVGIDLQVVGIHVRMKYAHVMKVVDSRTQVGPEISILRGLGDNVRQWPNTWNSNRDDVGRVKRTLLCIHRCCRTRDTQVMLAIFASMRHSAKERVFTSPRQKYWS